MKKFRSSSLLIAITFALLLTSCSEDEDDVVEPTPTTSAPTIQSDLKFTVSNTGATAYNFSFSSVDNPELELTRGKTYELTLNTPGHPFLINTINTLGTNHSYGKGVTNNGIASGTITFAVPSDAPSTLWYNCEFHSPMAGRIRVVDQDTIRAFQVANNGASSYTFTGEGLTNAANYNFTLTRGQTYTFTVSTPGHPFYINASNSTGTASAYNKGVTNNGTSNGTISFTVPMDAPDKLWYNCEFHASMAGVFSIIN